MEFLKISPDMASIVADALSNALNQYKSVIWLVPGGSNIPLVVDTMALIDESLTHTLIIMQTDERYGTLQSPDCNWRQLLQAGFNPKNAQVYPILVNDEETLAEASLRYNQTLQEQFDTADYRIGQFGIGTDGHTAGIKPDTASDSVSSVSGGL
jgi:6-phosphogluconolactonase/glucosamine-6-phosphate isomerase/deaminase